MPRHRLCLLLIAVLLLGEATAAPGAWAAGVPSSSPTTADNPAGLLAPDQESQLSSADGELRRPPAPVDGQRPRFVRQTGKNCAFASAAMLIDKWTGGKLRVSQDKLRRASRVPSTEGVSFAELARGVARGADISLRYSPGGGDPLTWNELMSRLERGGGAVLGGSYSRLPRHYQRHSREYASRGAAESGHAVYIERYERGKGGGRVWMMDPLARSQGYSGEWISAKALRRFAWINSRGLVTAAATPEPPPLAGYQFDAPQLDEWLLAGEQVAITLPIEVSRGWRKPEGLALRVRWQLLRPELMPEPAGATTIDTASELQALAELGPRQVLRVVDEPAEPEEGDAIEENPAIDGAQLVKLELTDGALRGKLKAPGEPGQYLLRAELRRRDGSPFEQGQAPVFEALPVLLRGDLAAELALVAPATQTLVGPRADVHLSVTNRGRADWTRDGRLILLASWRTSLGELEGAELTVRLEAGETGIFRLPLEVPSLVAEGSLHVELLTDAGFPLSELGSEPLVLPYWFVAEAPAG